MAFPRKVESGARAKEESARLPSDLPRVHPRAPFSNRSRLQNRSQDGVLDEPRRPTRLAHRPGPQTGDDLPRRPGTGDPARARIPRRRRPDPGIPAANEGILGLVYGSGISVWANKIRVENPALIS